MGDAYQSPAVDSRAQNQFVAISTPGSRSSFLQKRAVSWGVRSSVLILGMNRVPEGIIERRPCCGSEVVGVCLLSGLCSEGHVVGSRASWERSL